MDIKLVKSERTRSRLSVKKSRLWSSTRTQSISSEKKLTPADAAHVPPKSLIECEGLGKASNEMLPQWHLKLQSQKSERWYNQSWES